MQIALFTISGNVLSAHEIRSQLLKNQKSVAISIEYSGGEKFSYESYEIFPPAANASTPPFQTGRSDANGRILFLPDRPGTWKVRYFSKDGHGGEMLININGSGIAVVENTPLYLLFLKLTTGIAIIAGITGVLLFLYSRKKRN